ncbi:MAG TPA: Mur ligase domain-containing protein [Pontiella sp.]|nr:Mur ligase domain-containing protein [Pontiella sp.]
MPRIHFIGIGGVGMNGLAQLAVQSGYSVSGSDRAYDPNTELFKCLDALGITMVPQDGSGIGPQTAHVVHSTAIEPDNPDILQANRLGIPLLHRAEFLKELIGDDELIAVAGTAGKTTTTGLLGWIFQCLGMDPSVYNGAAVLNWKSDTSPGNVRKGASNLWIIEADESDKSFLHFYPSHSIITNISKDHYELDELHSMFDQFEEQTAGITLRGPVKNIQASGLNVPMPGRHNLENALCAYRLCTELGYDPDQVRDAVARFKGIERRLEVAGTVDGITVIDDYAHNAAKIAAALSSVSETGARVHAYWRPHGYTPLHQGLDDLTEAFTAHWKQNGGSLFILPVYYVGGTVEKKTTAADLVARLNSSGVPAVSVPDYSALKHELERCADAGDTILGMGARDPELPLFARRLITRWKTS